MTAYPEIKHLQDSLATLSRTLTRLEEDRDLARYRYEELDARCQDVDRTIAGLQEELHRSAPGLTSLDTPPAVDLRGCMNMKERLERIAIANGGLLDLAHALDVIVATGVSRAKESSLRGEIRKWVKRNPQDWENVGNGTYRYRRFADKDDEGP